VTYGGDKKMIDSIFSLFSTLISLIPFVEFGKLKIDFDDVRLDFFKPIVGRVQWSEDNYKNEPLSYRLKCTLRIYNGKKEVSGINNCQFLLRYNGLTFDDEFPTEPFKEILNLQPGECKEILVSQSGTTCFAENLKSGCSLVFLYTINGQKSGNEIIVKELK